MSARRESPEIMRLIERQLRNWELARGQRPDQRAPSLRQVRPFVTVSREVGSGGIAVAEKLGQRLHWPVFDKEILHAMAGDDRVRERLYESMDERDIHWLEEVMHVLVSGRLHSPHDYFRRLCRTVLAIARGGNAVFLGRGVDLILPREVGFRVRLVAPYEQRVEYFARRSGLEPDQAREQIERIEKERADFIRRHFRRDRDDPLRHDMILNMEHLVPEQAVELIVAALRIRGVVTGTS